MHAFSWRKGATILLTAHAPLKRAIQKYVQDPLAEKVLQGEFPDGSVIKVVTGSDRLNFERGAGTDKEAA